MKYLLYARAKHEFEVEEAIRDLGLWVAAPKSLERKRIGRTKRDVKFYDAPYVPNFLFAEIPADRFLDVVAVKHVAPTLTPVSRGDWAGGTDSRGNVRQGVAHFLDAVDSEYRARDKERENLNAPVWEFQPGQALEVLSGPFKGFMATFRRMIEQPHHSFAKVGAEAEVFGRTTPFEIDPLDVRSA